MPSPDDDPFDLPRRFGLTIVEVPDLAHPAVYVHGYDIGLVRAGLSHPCQASAAGWLLEEALRLSSAMQ